MQNMALAEIDVQEAPRHTMSTALKGPDVLRPRV